MRSARAFSWRFAPLIAAVWMAAGTLNTAARADTTVSPDGIRIAYETHGEGTPAIIFVHGWSCDRQYWRAQLATFVSQYKVIAVDLAGHGESASGRNVWSMTAFGGDVAAVVEKLELKHVVLVGHSMGGDVVIEAARRLPGRVAGIVWVDTYRQLDSVRTPEQVRALMAPFRSSFVATTRDFVRSMFPADADAALVERVALDMSAAPPPIALAAMEAALNFDREIPDALQQLKVPVVAINAEHPATDMPSMRRHGVDVILVPKVGHFLMLEDPKRFDDALRKAIGKFDR
jgi:pimeloyl-ACP methyl ester carboxylesterase